MRLVTYTNLSRRAANMTIFSSSASGSLLRLRQINPQVIVIQGD
jgi:hypothetical protein